MKANKMSLVVLSFVLLLSACGSTPKQDLAKNNSGYLSNYTNLKEVDSTEDNVLLKWESSEYKTRQYSSVIIDDISYYPAPKAGGDIDNKVLIDIAQYANTSIKNAAQSTGKVVDVVTDKTIRLRMAITGATINDEGLSAVQYLPIAFVASAVTGNLDNLTAKLVIEGEVTDAQSGELLATFIRTGLGVDVDDEEQPLTLEMVKPLLDDWAKLIKKNISENIK